jgi:hypothetical protein
MLKFSKISFFKEQKFVKEKRESVGILQNISLFQHAIFKFYLLFDKHVLKLPLLYYYYCSHSY